MPAMTRQRVFTLRPPSLGPPALNSGPLLRHQRRCRCCHQTAAAGGEGSVRSVPGASVYSLGRARRRMENFRVNVNAHHSVSSEI